MAPLLTTLGHDRPRRHLSHRHALVLPSFRFRRPWEGHREPRLGGSPLLVRNRSVARVLLMPIAKWYAFKT